MCWNSANPQVLTFSLPISFTQDTLGEESARQQGKRNMAIIALIGACRWFCSRIQQLHLRRKAQTTPQTMDDKPQALHLCEVQGGGGGPSS